MNSRRRRGNGRNRWKPGYKKVYSHYNKKTGKREYVGSTTSVKRRESQHRRSGALTSGKVMVPESGWMHPKAAERLEAKKIGGFRRADWQTAKAKQNIRRPVSS